MVKEPSARDNSIMWITRYSYFLFGVRACQRFYKSHLFPSHTKNDPSVCDIELGIKSGDSDREIEVTATQVKRELKPILGADNQSLEGTFKHTGSVRTQSKREQIPQSKEHKDIGIP